MIRDKRRTRKTVDAEEDLSQKIHDLEEQAKADAIKIEVLEKVVSRSSTNPESVASNATSHVAAVVQSRMTGKRSFNDGRDDEAGTQVVNGFRAQGSDLPPYTPPQSRLETGKRKW